MGVMRNKTNFRSIGWCAAFLLAAMLALAVPAAAPAPAMAEEEEGSTYDVVEVMQGAVAALQNRFGVDVGTSIFASERMEPDDSSCQWIAYDFVRLGLESNPKPFLDKLEGFVDESYASPTGGIDAYYPTEYDRLAMVVAALGGDPTSFGTAPDGSAVNLVADGSYNWSKTESPGTQGSNGWIYAIEAIYATGAEVPADARFPEEQMVSELVAMQADSGAFGLSAGEEDVDLTAMAICALAPHANEPGVTEAIDAAIDYLSSQQGNDGTFFFEGGSPSSESSSQVIMALCSVQIDPATDERFVKYGSSALDGLMVFRKADGSFGHLNDGSETMEVLPTEQALRALSAYYELTTGGDGNPYTLDHPMNISQPTALPGAGASTDGVGQGGQDGAGQGGVGQGGLATSWIPWFALGVLLGLVALAVIVVVTRARRQRDSQPLQ